jgi:hypothetical protein
MRLRKMKKKKNEIRNDDIRGKYRGGGNRDEENDKKYKKDEKITLS